MGKREDDEVTQEIIDIFNKLGEESKKKLIEYAEAITKCYELSKKED